MRFSLLLLLTTLVLQLQAQQADTITIKSSGMGGQAFYMGDYQLDKEGLKHVISKNGQAYEVLKKGLSQNTWAGILGGAGGFLIGYPLGAALAGAENPGWGLLAGGAGLVVLSIPIANSAKKNVTKAVRMYNHSLQASLPPSSSFALSLKARGQRVGLFIDF
jgi:hypothetical protein